LGESTGAFARKTSGVVRDVSLRDAFIFGITLAIPFAANFFLYPVYTFFLPGASWTIATLIAMVIALANYVIYSGFGSMMPRSGGDYVFQSRGVHPALSFLSVISWDVFLQAPLFGTLLLASGLQLGLTPFLTMAGAATGSTALINAGTWASSSTGIFSVSIVLLFFAYLANISGLKWVARSQKYILFPLIVISGLVIAILLFTSSPSSFTTAFNHYGQILNGTSNSYQTLVSATTSAGFVTPTFSWLYTLYLAAIIAISFTAWTVWTAPFFGEIKGANSFKGLLVTFIAGGLFQTFFLLIPELAGFEHALGSEIVNALAFQSFVGVPSLSFYPSFGILTLMLTNNVAVMFLASIGYMVAGYFMVQLFLTNMSRYLLAGSIDGALPLFLSSPSRRFRTPVNALSLSFIVMAVYVALVDLTPSQLPFWISVAVWTAPVLFFGTSLAGIVFPKTNPSIYKNSPIAKYRGLLTVASVVMFVLDLFILIGYLVIPELEVGLGTNASLIIVVFAIVGLLWYFLFKAYQARKGIDIGLTYKEIPPE
jgi:basic amino acid/polyamine antiporter, APA family